jgi:hypothetical protein
MLLKGLSQSRALADPWFAHSKPDQYEHFNQLSTFNACNISNIP